MPYDMQKTDDRIRAAIHDGATRALQALVEMSKTISKDDQHQSTEYGLLVEIELLAAQLNWAAEYTGYSTDEVPVMSPEQVGDAVNNIEDELLMTILVKSSRVMMIKEPDLTSRPDIVTEFFGKQATEPSTE